MDMSQYRDLFISESREYLRAIGAQVVALESEAADKEKIDSLFRAAHSLKGMASSMGYSRIAELAHKLEDFMDRFRRDMLPFTATAADLLLEGADLIETMIRDIEEGLPGEREIAELLGKLGHYEPGAAMENVPLAQVAAAPSLPEMPHPVDVVTETRTTSEMRRGRSESPQTVRVKTDVLDHLINITGELITTKHRLVNIGREIGLSQLNDPVTDLTRQLRELHNEVMSARMLPFAAISDRFPRMVRDLARKGGKEVSFEVVGKEIELDRGILEELADPLIHILRNAVDHGLEAEAERIASGKPVSGRITLSIQREKDLVIISVEDDGRGMAPEKLIETAVAKGIITAEDGQIMSKREALMLTCIPGFSTAREVTDVSGRGVGMDAVRATVKSLGGSLTIDSEVGQGSRFILKLPLTIAIVNVLLAETGTLAVAIPVSTVLRTLEVRRELIEVCGKQHMFHLDEEPLPLFSLQGIFSFSPWEPAAGAVTLFVCEVKGRKVGLAVNQFLGQQEVFVKPLGRPLARMRGIAGGAILGNGQVVFILDVANLF